MYVIGTAGHVDHGKSTLVKALTGIDPDRLKEEQERGMTIDLGFAWLTLPNGQEVSVVDVPGHERLVKNMLAGAGGIDLALLVVAADEGVMPQTREHLAILDLLRIARGVIVLTKRDLVDEEWLELVAADVQEVVKGTSLEGSPVVAVSSVTRRGLDQLLDTIQKQLQGLPPKRDTGRPRLPIDRAFSVAGFGTVVTGTLIDGRLAVGQEVEIVPKGIKARIRGLQSHKKKADEALPGTRVAVNLSGVDKEQLQRGDVLTTPGWLQASRALDAELRLIPAAPHALTHNTGVTFHAGAAESTARVRLLDADELQPEQKGWAQIVLDDPIAVARGDLFIIRSTVGTLGGGQVVEPFAKRHRRFHDVTLERLLVAQQGSPEEIVLKALESLEPCDARTLSKAANLAESQAVGVLQTLVDKGRALRLGQGGSALYYSHDGWQRLIASVRDAVQAHHRQFPLRRGLPKEEMRSRLKLSAATFALVAQQLVSEKTVLDEGFAFRLPSHQPKLKPEQERAAADYIRALESSPYSPPTDTRIDAELLGYLIDQRRVVRTLDDVVFSAPVFDDMVRRIVERIKANGKVTVAEMRDMFKTSRKYALAFMEYLDQQHITRRVGDDRVLRVGQPTDVGRG